MIMKFLSSLGLTRFFLVFFKYFFTVSPITIWLFDNPARLRSGSFYLFSSLVYLLLLYFFVLFKLPIKLMTWVSYLLP